MHARIQKPHSTVLANYIEYFLFLKNREGEGFYKTFPNTNLCLALYKQNRVDWNRESNTCRISENRATGQNRLWGFHKKPFSVYYSGEVEQVCIIFKAGGLSFFTKIPLHTLVRHDDPFGQLFGRAASVFTERLFSETGEKKQQRLLEQFLLENIRLQKAEKLPVLWALDQLRHSPGEEKNIVRRLSTGLSVNPSTLYRNFMSAVGQPPQEVYKTIRFRKTLATLLSGKFSFTEAAYQNYFFDQSHLIKDIRQFTGEAPHHLVKKVSEVDGTLIWLQR